MHQYFLFMDCDTGIEFVVSESSVELAYLIAKDWFADPMYICKLTEWEVDAAGYDVF